MLPSKGYFKNEPCPFYEGKTCDRPYCHFRHKKYDTSSAYLATLRAALDDFQLILSPPPEELETPPEDPTPEDTAAEEEPEAIPVAEEEKKPEIPKVVVEKKERELTTEQTKAIDEIVAILKRHPSRIEEITKILKRRSSRSSSHRKSSRSSRSSSHRRSSKRTSEDKPPESKKPRVEEEEDDIPVEQFLPDSDDDATKVTPTPRVSSVSDDDATEVKPTPRVSSDDDVVPRRVSSLMLASSALKPTRICPVANVSRMLRAPVPKLGAPKGARVEHSNGQWCPFLANIVEGSAAVPAAKRNVVLKRLYSAFIDSRMFFSKGEAGQEATKCEAEMFDKHRDSFRKYQLMLPSVLTAIKQKRYLGKHQVESDESEWYNLLLPCALTEEQLVDNGFPLETISESDGSVKINVFHNTAFAFNKKWKMIREAYRKGLRYCVRCNMEYKVDPDTCLQLVPNCVFHSERIRRQRGDRFYPCCNGDAGCQTEAYHVTDQLYEDMDRVVKSQPPKPGQTYRKILALDCEMVATTHGMELAHVVIVDMNGRVVYEAHVKPTHTVTSYLTQFSGMSEELLAKCAKKDLAGIQEDLMNLITSETLLIGHSLDSDLRALRLLHTLVIDTSVLYPPHEVNGDLRKQSLKRLAALHLMKAIQNNEHGHSAMEDAVASLELAKKKVENKYNKVN